LFIVRSGLCVVIKIRQDTDDFKHLPCRGSQRFEGCRKSRIEQLCRLESIPSNFSNDHQNACKYSPQKGRWVTNNREGGTEGATGVVSGDWSGRPGCNPIAENHM